VLVFFDDILVYSKQYPGTFQQHMLAVLQKLKEHELYAKISKCEFGLREIKYLGHVISEEGVATEKNKIKAIQDWPSPK
jgi:hypothetical protein